MLALSVGLLVWAFPLIRADTADTQLEGLKVALAIGAGGRRGVDFECIEDRRQPIAAVLERARSGDVVVLAGKGHERSMIYGSDKRPWNEPAVVLELLHQAGYRRQDTTGGSPR